MMYCFAKFCRLCINSSENLININTLDEDNISYYTKLAKCFPHVDCGDVNMVPFICQDCYVEVKKAYELQNLFIKSEATLKVYLEQLRGDSLRNINPSTLSVTLVDIKYTHNHNKNKYTLPEDDKENFVHIKVEPTFDFEENDSRSFDVEDNFISCGEILPKTEYKDTVKIESSYTAEKYTPVKNESDSNDDIDIQQTSSSDYSFSNKTETSSEYKSDYIDNSVYDYSAQNKNSVSESSPRYNSNFIPEPPYFYNCRGNNPYSYASQNIGCSQSFCNVPNLYSYNVQNSNLDAGGQVVAYDSNSVPVAAQSYNSCIPTTESSIGNIEDEARFGSKFLAKQYQNYRPDVQLPPPSKDSGSSNPSQRFECDMCSKTYKRKSVLIAHKRTHTGEKPFVCDVCSKGFTNRNVLNVHKKIHTGIKPYVCNQCDMSFCHSCSLVAHQRIHTGEKPYACTKCDKAFNSRSALRVHKATHSDERPYVCDYCKKAFAQASYLRLHLRIHTGEKPYVCELCNEGFQRLEYLKTHRLKHSGERPFVCDVCNKRFSQKVCLKFHKRIHTGEKPYHCSQCHMKFGRISNLKSHEKLHQDKPYICKVCPKYFAAAAEFEEHLRRAHNKE